MSIYTENINILWGSLLVEELARNEITYFCLSPGSRSTPLTVAVARNESVQHIICYDERAAAFHALGYARATGKPAVLISTSGTAVANYLPAVIEASVDAIPMLVLSADRPPELRETGANQTIRQPEIYGDYVRWHFDLPCPDTKIPPSMVLTTADQAVHRARRSPAGPVHLNCMFREPLAPVSVKVPQEYLEPLEGWRNSQRPYTIYSKTITLPEPESFREIADVIRQAERGLLVAAALRFREEREAVRHLARMLKWPVFPDILSGLRFDGSLKNAAHYFDQLLLSGKMMRRIRPDVILHIGGRLTSKRFLQFIGEQAGCDYLLAADQPFRQDPEHKVTMRIDSNIEKFCRQLESELAGSPLPEPESFVPEKSRRIAEIIEKFVMKSDKLSEPAVTRIISRDIPSDQALFLASSMPVREMDMYGDAGNSFIPVAANRGASGIDGTIATAAGFAAGQRKPVTLLIGDLAFLHDLNSLSLLRTISFPVIIVLVNNRGGGIFSFLPISQFDDIFEKFFGTPHDFEPGRAADLFGLEYHLAGSLQDFREIYRRAVKEQKSAVIEIRTDRNENLMLHKELQAKIKEALESE